MKGLWPFGELRMSLCTILGENCPRCFTKWIPRLKETFRIKIFFFKKNIFIQIKKIKKIFFLFYFFVFCIESLQSKLTREKKWFFVGGVWRGVARGFAKKQGVPLRVFFAKKCEKNAFFVKKRRFFAIFRRIFAKNDQKIVIFAHFFFFIGGLCYRKKRAQGVSSAWQKPANLYSTKCRIFGTLRGTVVDSTTLTGGKPPFGPSRGPREVSSRRQNCPRNFPVKFFFL